jgi:hypothetical protein
MPSKWIGRLWSMADENGTAEIEVLEKQLGDLTKGKETKP